MLLSRALIWCTSLVPSSAGPHPLKERFTRVTRGKGRCEQALSSTMIVAMGKDVAGRAGREPIRYEIVVVGELTDAQIGLEGLSVAARHGRSTITGDIVDQSQLHGLLDRLGSMGLELVSVRSVKDTDKG